MKGKQTPSLLAGFKRLLFAPLVITLMAMGNTPACASMQKVVQKRAVCNKQALPTDTIYSEADQMPMFKGGTAAMQQYLIKNVKYPKSARKAGLEGRVVVYFVVEKDGSLTNVKVPRSMEPVLDAEAIKAVKAMPKWTPGLRKGKPVRVERKLFVWFKLKQ